MSKPKHPKCWRENGKKVYDPDYFRWRNMMNRCYRQSCPIYSEYGARGIKVCKRWHSYDNYKDDIAMLAGRGTEIDRINNDGPYSPTNCRWATKTINLRNTRRRKEITWSGRTQHYIDWAQELGINPDTLRNRVFRRKWHIDRAMTEGISA